MTGALVTSRTALSPSTTLSKQNSVVSPAFGSTWLGLGSQIAVSVSGSGVTNGRSSISMTWAVAAGPVDRGELGEAPGGAGDAAGAESRGSDTPHAAVTTASAARNHRKRVVTTVSTGSPES